MKILQMWNMIMNINIDYKNRTPIYEQIVDDIEKYVSLGILKEGEQIMSIREMAINLGINPNTVKKAYDILEQKNIITTVSTKGTYITTNTKQVIENKIEKEIIAIKIRIPPKNPNPRKQTSGIA